MPLAGDAFLTTTLPAPNNPLLRITSQPFKPEFDLAAFLQQVETFVTDYLIPVIKDLTGIDLSFLKEVFQGIDLTAPGGILAAIPTAVQGIIQLLIDTLVNGLVPGNSTAGNDVASLGFALIQAGLAVPASFISAIDSLWAVAAELLGAQTALQNTPGVVLTDVFATTGVAGWTNIVGTLALSSGGQYVQTPNLTVAYRNTGPATDKHGAQITIDGNMQGCCRVGICSDTTASNYAALEVYSGFEGDAVRLVTGSDPALTVVQQQADFITPRVSNTNVYDIWYDPAPNTFHVLRNLQPVFDWVDSGNIVTHGSTKRRVLLVSNGFDNDEDGSYGPGIRKFQAYDKA